MFKKYLQPVVVFRSGARVKLIPCASVKYNTAPEGLSSITLEGIPETEYNGHAVIGSLDLKQVVAIELHSCYYLMTLKDLINFMSGKK